MYSTCNSVQQQLHDLHITIELRKLVEGVTKALMSALNRGIIAGSWGFFVSRETGKARAGRDVSTI
jgi:hypothetical protein